MRLGLREEWDLICLQQQAGIVSDDLRALVAEGFCSLDAYVGMPNHVHVLWTAHIRLSQVTHRTKGPTDRWANELLGRAGKPFWQEEYFDRQVRNADELAWWRIPGNFLGLVPVSAKAGLKARADLSPPSGTRLFGEFLDDLFAVHILPVRLGFVCSQIGNLPAKAVRVGFHDLFEKLGRPATPIMRKAQRCQPVGCAQLGS